MPAHNAFDFPIAWKDDGTPDLWDHDTMEGRERIAKRQAEAAAIPPSRPAVPKPAISRKELETVVRAIAGKFAKEREAMLDGIAAAIAETERNFDRKLAEQRQWL